MLLKEAATGHLVEVLELGELFSPLRSELIGRYQFGEESQDPEPFKKKQLIFPSGEPLPKCWTDPHYRDAELPRKTGI